MCIMYVGSNRSTDWINTINLVLLHNDWPTSEYLATFDAPLTSQCGEDTAPQKRRYKGVKVEHIETS